MADTKSATDVPKWNHLPMSVIRFNKISSLVFLRNRGGLSHNMEPCIVHSNLWESHARDNSNMITVDPKATRHTSGRRKTLALTIFLNECLRHHLTYEV